MKSANIPLISVIVPPGPEAVLTMDWVRAQLKRSNYELINESWSIGAAQAAGEFVCFLENDCVLSEDYFYNLLHSFTDKRAYRKLAMVVPALAVNSWERYVYGYLLGPREITPVARPSSSEPYTVQIGYVPGAIIRRSALGVRFPLPEAGVRESAKLSAHFWTNGNYVLLDPRVSYVTTNLEAADDLEQDMTLEYVEPLLELFAREYIG